VAHEHAEVLRNETIAVNAEATDGASQADSSNDADASRGGENAQINEESER